MSKLHVMNHALINHKLTFIRDKDTNTKDFREAVNEVGGLMTFLISEHFPTKEVEIETPIQKTKCRVLDRDIIIVPILRAGLGMVDGIHKIIPQAKIGHVGMYRDEETLEPKEYYAKFPPNIAEAVVLVVDPMLATGGSACMAVEAVKKRGAKNISFVGLVGAPEGVERLQDEHPDVDIYLAALDEKLNEVGYIIPGLGDCGDRLFGTK